MALGNEEVKQDLRDGKNGIFEINYIKWKKIVNKVEQEELEAILAQGIEDI
jgi:predicted ATP-grasp superfamily ATP-dependent carboligase